MTICFFIAVDLVLQLRMTYQIVQQHFKVTDEVSRNGELRKRKMVTTLVLAELTEGLTPLVYATVVSMAYYGPNITILGNVRLIEDVTQLFRMMLLLFGIDILSVIVNFKILSKWTGIDLYEEFCMTMKRYWTVMAVKFAFNSCLYFGSKDVNFGVESEWGWITQEGWIQLINNTSDIPDEEKAILLAQQF